MKVQSKLVLFAVATSLAASAQPLASIKIGSETEPPGGLVQIKVFMTEPSPISTGSTKFSLFDDMFSSIDGIALFAPAGDVYGAAVVDGMKLRFTFVSPARSFGTTPDYPMLTIAASIKDNVPIGTQATLNFDPNSLNLYGLLGPYRYELNPGTLTVAEGVSVTNVVPGSRSVPAGGIVALLGVNFTAQTDVRIDEARIAEIRFINSTRLDLVMAKAVTMHGKRIRVTNRDGSNSVYYSYQRTVPGYVSNRKLLAKTVPVFSGRSFSAATFVRPPTGPQGWFGVALQNVNSTAVGVTIEAANAAGSVIGTLNVVVPPNTRIVKSGAEWFPQLPAFPIWRVKGNSPVESLGLAGDDGTGVVQAVAPSAVQ